MRDTRFRDFRAQPFRQACRFLRVGFRQEQDEFLAAPAGQQIALADGRPENPRHGLQHLVAMRVAMGIVDVLEQVDASSMTTV